MFALKQIIDEKLYAISTTDGTDAFHQCFDKWQDVSHLHDFFTQHPEALQYYRVDRKTAVRQVLSESRKFFEDILEIANKENHEATLDHSIFIPLHKSDDFDLPLIEAKAYGTQIRKCYLRLYAVRLSDGCYIVVGGIIKTSRSLQNSDDGKEILLKLKEVAGFLRTQQMEDAFDIGALII